MKIMARYDQKAFYDAETASEYLKIAAEIQPPSYIWGGSELLFGFSDSQLVIDTLEGMRLEERLCLKDKLKKKG